MRALSHCLVNQDAIATEFVEILDLDTIAGVDLAVDGAAVDFSEYSPGTAVPTGWIEWPGHETEMDENILATDSLEDGNTPVGGYWLKAHADTPTAKDFLLLWDSEGDFTDVEVLGSFIPGDTKHGIDEGVVVRFQATGNAWYMASVDDFAHEGRIMYNHAGAETLIERTVGKALAVEPSGTNIRTFVRFRASGSDLKAKWWQEPDPEPAGWDIEVTDTNIPDAGPVGLYANFGYTLFDEFAYATGGDTAQFKS
jgi:hypothetical protein